MAGKNNKNDMNEILAQLSGRLNISPEQLENAAKGGDVKKLLKNADSAQAKQIESVLSDPEQTKRLLESPQAQALLKLFGGE